MNGSCALALGLALSVLASCASGSRSWTVADLASSLADAGRSAEDRARDGGRKPAEVVQFLGIERGMTVLDLLAASGWYTEVLSVAVGPKGRVYAQNTSFLLEMRGGYVDRAISARLAGDHLPNVTRLDEELNSLSLEPESLDAAVTALNFHDLYNGYGPDATVSILSAVYDRLKPGGIFGVIDHVGAAGLDNEKLHRIERSRAIEAATRAGFTLEAESDLLRNPADDHTQSVFAPGLRGRTDRFVLRLRKPSRGTAP